MKKNIFIYIFCFFVLPLTTLAEEQASSTQNILPTLATEKKTSILEIPEVPKIIAEIQAGKKMLAEVKLNYDLKPVTKTVKDKKTKKKKAVTTGYKLNAKDLALAIYDPATGQISTVSGIQKDKTITFNNPNFDIKQTSFNGVNSQFKINSPQGGFVVALKYLISPVESGSRAQIENSFYEAIYTPYSNYLNTPEVASFGAKYIDQIVIEAARQISHIPSSSKENSFVPEAITPALVKALLYAEHMNGGDIASNKLAKDVVDRLNVLFAINQEDTYKYSVSSAGARGLSQFMPKTYLGLVQRHPSANLAPDFVSGMDNHVNAIKATYLLLDDYAGAVRQKAKDSANSGQAFDYGAASYNGGVSRVVSAVKTFGPHWNLPVSETINKLQADVSSLSSNVKSLNTKIKTTKDSKVKAELQTQLSETKARESDAKEALKNAKNSALRTETIVYLQKIYKVISVLSGNES